MPTIHDVVFNPRISTGARGGPKFFTTIIAASSGFEKSIANWQASRRSFDVGHVVESQEKLAYVLAFFVARQGRAYGFLFRDPMDYRAGMKWANNVLVPDAIPEILPVLGNGATTAFQLTKTYSDAAATIVRPITRPTITDFFSGASVAPIIYQKLSGVWTVISPSAYTISASTGVVTFTTPPSNTVQIGWAGQFYIPARFDTDEMSISLEAANIGEWQSIPIIEVRV